MYKGTDLIITFNPLEKLRRKLPFFVGGIIFLFGVFHVFTAVFATPPTSSYIPGETMSPSCVPGDTNCKVALTAGSILFSDGNTLISQDNSNLYWDDVNNRLGIGDSTPLSVFTVGNGDLFQVNSSGAIVSAAGITSSGTITFLGLTANQPVITTTGGQLITEAQLALSRGGTNKNIVASNGGIVWTDADSQEVLSGTAIANQVLLSGNLVSPSWSTATYPATTAINQLLYSSAANTIAGLSTVNNGVLVTSGTGIPSIATDIPTAVTIGGQYVYRVGGTDVAVADGGTGVGSWTNGQLLIGNTTGNTAALGTLTGTANQITVTNGASSITLSTPQDIATVSAPQFARLGLGGAAHATDILTITSADTTANSKALNIAHSGAITGTGYGLYVSKTGVSTTNIGGYFSASGATNNYGLIVENGNVGIGTTDPDAKLKVFNTGVGPNSGLIYAHDQSSGANPNPIFIITNGGTGDSTRIQKQDGTVQFIVKSAGNVGIGTTVFPADAGGLTIAGHAAGSPNKYFIDLTRTDQIEAGGGIRWRGSDDSILFQIAGQGGGTPGIYFKEGTTDRMVIRSGGNVGIGTALPGAFLDVEAATTGGTAAIGPSATATGSRAIALGYGASVSGTDSVSIGSNFTVSGINSLGIALANMTGTTLSASNVLSIMGGNVGIGTVTPGATFVINTVSGSPATTASIGPSHAVTANGTALNVVNNMTNVTTDGINKYGIFLESLDPFTGGAGAATNNYGIYIDRVSGADNNYAFVTTANSGNVGIGTASPGTRLTVRGSAGNGSDFLKLETTAGYFRNIYLGSGGEDGYIVFNNGSNSSFLSNAGAWINASDIAYKTNIKDMAKYGLNTVLQMKPKEYQMKFDLISQIGFIAQEMETIVPEVVSGQEGHKGISYGQITPILTKAIQEQQTQIEGINLKMEDLEKKISEYQTSVSGSSEFSVESIYNSILTWLEDKVVKVKELTTETIVVDKALINELSVKKITVENGINIKDSITGNIWCIGIANGEWSKISGECGSAPAAPQTDADIAKSDLLNTQGQPSESDEIQPQDDIATTDVDSQTSEVEPLPEVQPQGEF